MSFRDVSVARTESHPFCDGPCGRDLFTIPIALETTVRSGDQEAKLHFCADDVPSAQSVATVAAPVIASKATDAVNAAKAAATPSATESAQPGSTGKTTTPGRSA